MYNKISIATNTSDTYKLPYNITVIFDVLHAKVGNPTNILDFGQYLNLMSLTHLSRQSTCWSGATLPREWAKWAGHVGRAIWAV